MLLTSQLSDLLTTRFTARALRQLVARDEELSAAQLSDTINFDQAVRQVAFDLVENAQRRGLLAALAAAAARARPLVSEAAELARLLDAGWPPDGVRAPQVKVSGSRLPGTGGLLLGRERELGLLDAAWDSAGGTRVVTIVAMGGVGKTSLIHHWRNAMSSGPSPYRNAKAVFDWSFFDRGTKQKNEANAAEFLREGLAFFGDTKPTKNRSLEQQGSDLADLIRKQRTLLILDGLESLLSPGGSAITGAELKDEGIRALLRGLVEPHTGLCVVTSRVPIADLFHRPASCQRIDLSHLPDSVGARLLHELGVEGSEEERAKASAELRGVALAIELLGTFIASAYHNRHIEHRHKVALLTQQSDSESENPAVRVLRSYERWLGKNSLEVAVLRVLGLFDRPAPPDCLAALRSEPPIVGLTESLTALAEEDWNRALTRLKTLKLLQPASPLLDAHPLVREYFRTQLRSRRAAAWRAGHNRLFEYLSAAAPPLPKTAGEMSPLFEAVAHGCSAERYHEALRDVYEARILQNSPAENVWRYYSTDVLGAYAESLTALCGFYERRWAEPVADLDSGDRAFVLHETAVQLFARGRFSESVEPFEGAEEGYSRLGKWEYASPAARYRSELSALFGELGDAKKQAEIALEYSKKADDRYEQRANYVACGEVLFHAGNFEGAAGQFQEAAQVQYKDGTPIPNSFFFSELGYCELLLETGRAGEALERAMRARERIDETNDSLLARAQIYLALGTALIADPTTRAANLSAAAKLLDQSVEWFRGGAGHQGHLPRGLLARARLRRIAGDAESKADLDAVLAIATRDKSKPMKLFEADCYLGYTLWHLDRGERGTAERSLEQAIAIVAKTGYGRRQREITELQGAIASRSDVR